MKSDLKGKCVVCDDSKTELHHIRHVHHMNKQLSSLIRDKVMLSRKQVPLCRRCHNLVHGGKYDGTRL